ncbi:MAG: WD40 repeat domain-containing protein [Planctomycetota bacterium]|nr:WD40 repeat domain-containing protein [Planctomycetota bacterium]
MAMTATGGLLFVVFFIPIWALSGRFTSKDGAVLGIWCSDNCNTFVTGYADGVVRVFDLASPELTCKEELQVSGPVHHAYHSEKGNLVSGVTGSGEVFIFDSASSNFIYRQHTSNTYRAWAVRWNGKIACVINASDRTSLLLKKGHLFEEVDLKTDDVLSSFAFWEEESTLIVQSIIGKTYQCNLENIEETSSMVLVDDINLYPMCVLRELEMQLEMMNGSKLSGIGPLFSKVDPRSIEVLDLRENQEMYVDTLESDVQVIGFCPNLPEIIVGTIDGSIVKYRMLRAPCLLGKISHPMFWIDALLWIFAFVSYLYDRKNGLFSKECRCVGRECMKYCQKLWRLFSKECGWVGRGLEFREHAGQHFEAQVFWKVQA